MEMKKRIIITLVTLFVLGAVVLTMTSVHLMAAGLLSSYQLIKDDYPEFVTRLKNGGATEADIERFLLALDQKVIEKGPLNEANFNQIMLSCVEELLGMTAHRSILQALLTGFPDEVKYAMQGKLHPGLVPLRNAVLQAMLGTEESTPGSSPTSGGPASSGKTSDVAKEVSRQLSQNRAFIELKTEPQVTTLSIPGSALQEISSAAKNLDIIIGKVLFRLQPGTVQVSAGNNIAFSSQQLSAEKAAQVLRYLSSGQKAIGPIYEFSCSTEDSIFGINFAKPVTVIISYEGENLSGIDEDKLDVFRFNEQTKKWVPMNGSPNPATKTITFTTSSFGKYAILEDIAEIAADGKPEVPVEIMLKLDELNATVNGKSVTLDAKPYLKPVVNRTMVPLRFLSESLGAKVTWKAESEQVVIEDNNSAKTMILTINSEKAIVDGMEKNLDCPAEMLPPGRTFVPLRFVSENLDAKVVYDAKNRAITISR
ncbi:MAG: copper amine oxidase N-terminal domain-containing protein [Firmicutes bacterium]|nr:copper amine oxidase N-terminal domain-containing protein [Bacillota bacterium]